MTRTSLVAEPALSFAEMAARLGECGWKIDSRAAEPIVPGEPEWAIFVHAGSTPIHYTFNPVVSLRVLNHAELDGEWERVWEKVPGLDRTRLRSLLESGDKRKILLGLFGAGELREWDVLDLAATLCEHPDARVSAAAANCRDVLIEASLPDLRGLASGGRGAARIFAAVPIPEWRRQALRWIGRERAESNGTLDGLLCAGLEDPDAEVRMTAVLIAAKLNAKRTIACMRRMRVPGSTSEGADKRQRLFYREVWRAAVRYLGAGYASDAFQQAIRGTLEVKDDPTLLLHSLMTPVELGAGPGTLPAGIDEHGRIYRLSHNGPELRWVARVAHWLGEDAAQDPYNPVRLVQPGSGFFIGECAMVGLFTFEEAVQLCLGLSLQCIVELPTADEWEMAARGPDGRRYPWGNTLIPDWSRNLSPWGVRDMVGKTFEWARTDEGEPVKCGGPGAVPCAKRTRASDEKAAVRVLVRTPPPGT